MTACSVFVADDAAYLLTDTAVHRQKRRDSAALVIWRFAPKVAICERLRIGVAMAGHDNIAEYDDGRIASPLGAVHDLFDFSATQQDVLNGLPRALEKTDRDLLEMTSGSGNFTLAIALWRESGPEGYFVCSSGAALPGVQPYTLVRVNNFVSPDVPLELDANRLANDKSEAIALIEAQRRVRWTEGSCKGLLTIGGEGQLTRVDGDGITTETIVRWPDRVGRRIDPRQMCLRTATANVVESSAS